MRENKILLVSDFVGVGKVALSSMIPILNTMEANVSYLPTAVPVSGNTMIKVLKTLELKKGSRFFCFYSL